MQEVWKIEKSPIILQTFSEGLREERKKIGKHKEGVPKDIWKINLTASISGFFPKKINLVKRHKKKVCQRFGS
ncbi:MAG: hypothetical protein HC880_01000 [Bacteroidia bacterium]|nr:hypothetical protein [Bacteroidia bacterium]